MACVCERPLPPAAAITRPVRNQVGAESPRRPCRGPLSRSDDLTTGRSPAAAVPVRAPRPDAVAAFGPSRLWKTRASWTVDSVHPPRGSTLPPRAAVSRLDGPVSGYDSLRCAAQQATAQSTSRASSPAPGAKRGRGDSAMSCPTNRRPGQPRTSAFVPRRTPAVPMETSTAGR